MSTANDLGYDDDLNEQPDEAEQKRAAFEQRKAARDAERKELEDLRAEKAERERAQALDKAKAELNASGPLGLYLRTYKGEPTADAIRKAVADDPDAKDAITFEPDPRDSAAAAQASMAAKNKGGDPIGAKALTQDTAPGQARLAAAYAAKTPKQTST